MIQRTFADVPSPTERAQRGIDSAHDHAEADSPGWTELAAEELRTYALTAGDFIVEQARIAITPIVGAPEELRAWGAVTQMAQRRGWIARTGHYLAASSSNGSPKPVYRCGVDA